jgi:hypothetical protein
VAGVNVLLDTNVLSEPMRERPAFADGQIAAGFEGPAHSGADILKGLRSGRLQLSIGVGTVMMNTSASAYLMPHQP